MNSPFERFSAFPPPSELQDECIRAMVECIVEAVDPRRVILFGSRARGDYHLESDVDFLVEMDGRLDPKQRRDATISARVSVADAPLPKDVVVLGSEQVSEEAKIWHSVVHVALSDGRVLYARPVGQH